MTSCVCAHGKHSTRLGVSGAEDQVIIGMWQPVHSLSTKHAHNMTAFAVWNKLKILTSPARQIKKPTTVDNRLQFSISILHHPMQNLYIILKFNDSQQLF